VRVRSLSFLDERPLCTSQGDLSDENTTHAAGHDDATGGLFQFLDGRDGGKGKQPFPPTLGHHDPHLDSFFHHLALRHGDSPFTGSWFFRLLDGIQRGAALLARPRRQTKRPREGAHVAGLE
jgi:hypothetical protein